MIPSIEQSNQQIIKLITSGEPFIISRLGSHETQIVIDYNNTGDFSDTYMETSNRVNMNGIYCREKKKDIFKQYCKFYDKCLQNSDLLASFTNVNFGYVIKMQDYFSKRYNIKQIHSRSIEPFYQVQDNIKPWSHYLHGKKVLIINPFVDSFKKQQDNGFKIFKNKNMQLFLPDQEFIFYKSYQTIAGNHIHNNWFDTFLLMCKDISKIDFDIALLGCGGYGLPLCNFIKMNLKKSAIYIGGGLQLMFGVMGGRWENNQMWKQIIKENHTQFIKPSGNEVLDCLKTIEGGCYI
jgi:hypothetical protein